MLCVRQFNHDGSFRYAPHGHAGADGDVILVNGAPWPALQVERRKYRFRILNASNATTFTLALTSALPFVQIATDGGLMARPVEVSRIPIAMAERVEVVIDFSAYAAGDSVVLRNTEGFAASLDIVGIKLVEDLQIFLVTSADVSMDDGSVHGTLRTPSLCVRIGTKLIG